MTRGGRFAAACAAAALVAAGSAAGASPPPDTAPAPESSTTTATTTTEPLPVITPEAWARFDEIVSGRLVGRGDRAAGVAVSYRGRLMHANAFGTRSPDDPSEAATVTDRFRIASISKLVTAIVVLQLVGEGRLSLDAPVGTVLADGAGVAALDPSWLPVTVRGLLSHTDGVPSYRKQFFDGTFASCEAAAAHGLARPLARTPGVRHEYSNLDFCLLGKLIEHVTGVPYQQAVTERLLSPLGITGMRMVATFDPDPDEVVHASGQGRVYMQALGAAGAWVATPTDLVRILDSLDPGAPGWHPLPPELADLARRPVAGVAFPEPAKRVFGLGTIIWPDGSWGHSGTVESTHSMLARRPDGVSWSILVSGTVPDDTERLADLFADALAAAGIVFV